ncbi:MAG: Transmembrane component of energizing module of predicted pantothenate ECF transporter [uncultured Rubrobacteraceae bacterium]|uniref:Transmembrane component of energizing module of predicted pantothenate ECF transporter n=1 Tax=uncultured Rubrobacteraceae bacterium TaxID=349277 RepID=A0A6J4QT83_9ACTN|nr:MAG: Transmembrane component of energizing module of predicted pantothenate ECF transporter [uncultured Rubrobacteraceae bacterium]
MLELQRNVIFGQYVDTGSFIHRMDARIKLVITFIFVVASFLIGDFVGFGIALLLLVLMQIVSRIPFGFVLRGSQFFLAFLLFILVFQVLFYPGEASNYLWRWGILSVSTEGLYTAGILGLRVIFLYHVTTMLMLTTSLVDLTNGLELIFAPLQSLRLPVNELVLVFVIAIKFVPIFIEEMERLARAQTARGVPFDEGGAVTRARRIGRLLVPIFISGFARADTLTTAMNTRSYRGGRGRTKYRLMEAKPSDWAVLALVLAWMIVAWLV